MSATGAGADAPRRLGGLTLYEPIETDPSGGEAGAWVGRETGRVHLIRVDLVPGPDLLHRPDVTRLTHPAVESLLDRRREEGRLVQLRELILGVRQSELLAAIEARGERLPLSLVRGWAEALFDGLEFLESVESAEGRLGLHHGALRPETTWVTFAGALRLGEHALVRVRSPEDEPTLADDAEAARRDAGAAVRLFARWLGIDADGGPGRRADVPADLARALEAWREDGVGPLVSIVDWLEPARRHLRLLPPPPDPLRAAEWLRARIPEAEAAALARLGRIRSAARSPSNLAPDDDQAPTRSLPDLTVRPEPFEPSVITMPGSNIPLGRPAPDDRPTAPVRDPRPPRSRRWPVSAPAVAGIAAALILAGWWIGQRVVFAPVSAPPRARPAPPTSAREGFPSSPASADDRVPLETAPPPSAASTPPPLAPAPDPDVGSSRGDPADRPNDRLSAPGSGHATRRGRTSASARDEPRPGAGASDSSSVEPTIPGLLADAEARPDDPRAFETVLSALRAEADRLTDLDRREELQAAVRRAERTWSLRDLRSATERWARLSR